MKKNIFEYEAESFMVPMDEFDLYEYGFDCDETLSLKDFMTLMVEIYDDATFLEETRIANIYHDTMRCMHAQIEMIAYIVEKYGIYPSSYVNGADYAKYLIIGYGE